MKIVIVVRRSESWVHAQRLSRGENTPLEIEVEVEVSTLSEDARKVLLSARWDKAYPKKWDGSFGSDFTWGGGSYGKRLPLIDSDSPTPEQISAALVKSDLGLAVERAEKEREKAEILAERARAEQERKGLESRKAAARELLADEFDRLNKRVKYLEGELDEAREQLQEADAE